MQNELIIKATQKTPFINFDAATGRLLIHGYSLPENSLGFYKPVLDWLDKYMLAPNKKTEFDIRLIILNTSSSKQFMDIIRKINQLVELNTTEVSIAWYYEIEDEDLYEIILQYKELCKAKFDIIATQHKIIE
jgi:hypothetical protein